MASIFYNKAMCEQCYNDRCSQHGTRNVHMNDKTHTCNSFIDENKKDNINKEDEKETVDDYFSFDGLW